MKSKNANAETLKFFGILAIGLVIVLGVFLLLQIPNGEDEEDQTQVRQFNSLQEIESFLKENSDNYYGGYGLFAEKAVAGDVTTAQAEASGGERASDFSKTNIQVEGVDEPDIVKNDGKYIYTVVDNNKVVIVNAYPANEMKVLSEIRFNENDNDENKNSENNYIDNIFINGDKLVIFGRGYEYIDSGITCNEFTYELRMPCGGYSKQSTFVNIYDISDRGDPELEDTIEVEGDYVDARMINDYVYLISSKYINFYYDDTVIPLLPSIEVNGIEKRMVASDVSYFPVPDSNYIFTTVTAINLDNAKTNSEVFLTGYSSTIYVSEDNIYLSYQRRIPAKDYYEKLIEDVFLELLPDKEGDEVRDIMKSDIEIREKMEKIGLIVQKYSNSLEGNEKEEFDKELMEKMKEFQIDIQKEIEKTIVHRISIDGLEIDYKGVGEVPGRVLNQFSMDEHKGYLRIATTTGDTWSQTSLNHLYILDINDKDMEIAGSVEDLAKGEQIYSARFIGDRAYMVTFKKIDPLFVIDVKNPKSPEVLGYLKITGYSDYLHPYNEEGTLIIGVGKETRGGDENFAWYQGVKVSLFDATDVEAPKELAKIEIGDRGTDSYALHDHKAFLFDRKRDLLILPILLAEIDEGDINEQRRWNGDVDSTYGKAVWQGAYVMKIDKEAGEIKVVGKVTHMDENDFGDDNQRGSWIWRYYDDAKSVKRSLYMDNFLYTISNAMIKANDINNDYNEVNSLKLPHNEVEPPIYYEDSFAGSSGIVSGVASPSLK